MISCICSRGCNCILISIFIPPMTDDIEKSFLCLLVICVSLKKNNIYYLSVSTSVPVCGYVNVLLQCPRSLKRTPALLGLELQLVGSHPKWVLGIKAGFLEKSTACSELLSHRSSTSSYVFVCHVLYIYLNLCPLVLLFVFIVYIL